MSARTTLFTEEQVYSKKIVGEFNHVHNARSVSPKIESIRTNITKRSDSPDQPRRLKKGVKSPHMKNFNPITEGDITGVLIRKERLVKKICYIEFTYFYFRPQKSLKAPRRSTIETTFFLLTEEIPKRAKCNLSILFTSYLLLFLDSGTPTLTSAMIIPPPIWTRKEVHSELELVNQRASLRILLEDLWNTPLPPHSEIK